jgi:excinuclease ABC subunit B
MFELVSDYAPAGDQPQAIAKLTEGILSGAKHQVLLGVTDQERRSRLRTVAGTSPAPRISLPTETRRTIGKVCSVR